MKWGLPAEVDSPLGKRVATLTFLRLVVLTLLLVIIELYYLRAMPFGGFSTMVAVGTVGAAFLLSAAYTVTLRSGHFLRLIAFAQLLTDQLVWTAMVYISGGVTSGSTSLYGLTCVSGAILVGTRGALWAAGCGIVSYLSACLGFAYGWLPVPTDQVAGAYVVDPREMIYPAFSTVVATALVALLAAHLAERLRAFGGRLEVATKRAEEAERLAALGRLAAGLAHEIRNPLGSICGSIELMRTGTNLGTEDKQLCEIIEREARRLSDLVTDMVDLSRPRAPDHQEVNLATIATGVVELARHSARGGQLQIAYVGPESLMVKADPAQMRQVLWNLVRNAMQASEENGAVSVEVSHNGEGGDALLSVQDSGPGLSKEDQEHIFNAFFTTRSHGVGIGLTVVKQVCDGHGFEIDVDTGDSGTNFTVRIPKAMIVLAAVVLLLVPGCGGQDWIRGDHEQLWWDDDLPNVAGSAQVRPPPAGSAGPTTSALKLELVGKPGTVSKFRNTYYDFPQEAAASSGATKGVFDADCKLIREVPAEFHDAVCVQGSGRLATGHTISFARRDCECAAECPRTDQQICFDKLDQNKFPYGRGARGTAITPMRSVAVDSTEIPLGTMLYIPEFQGLRRPNGTAHDGCFVAEDRGLKVVGKHVDIFTGSPETTKSWNRAVPSNIGVTVIVGASRCAHLRKP